MSNAGLIAGLVLGLGLPTIGISVGVVVLLRRRKPTRLSDLSLDFPMEVPRLTGVRVFERIGGGNFGTEASEEVVISCEGDVYQGEWQGVKVALKKLKMPEMMTELMKEVSTMQKLRHPHIVQVHFCVKKC